jgi:multiple sugar transport system substrate-binding protein
MRLRFSKRTLFFCLAVVAAVALVALPLLAGSGGKGEGKAPSKSVKGQTITVIGVQDPWFFAVEEVLPQFEQETGIQVKLEGLAWDALQARITTSFITKESGIDVVNVDDSRLAQFAENQWIIRLTDLIRRDKAEVKMNEFVPQAIYSGSEWRGDIYTLPVAVYSQFVMYRTDLLDRAGLKKPPTEFADWWTWDAYMDYVKKLDALGPDIHGTVIVGAQPVPIVHMYTGLEVSRGVRWFKQFPQSPWDFTPTINTKKSVDTLKFYKELYAHSPAESINYVWFDAGTAFSKQDIGIFYWWSPYGYLINRAGYMVPEFSKNVGKYGYAVMPYQPGEEKLFSEGQHGLGIPVYSDKQEAAWTFIKWFTSAQGQKKMALTKLRAFNDFAREPLFKDPELVKDYPMLPVQLIMLQHADGKVSRPHMPVYPSLEGFYGLQLNSALSGDKTPEEAMKDVQTQWEVILKQNLYIPYVAESYNDIIENTLSLISELSP